jgi:hypothetical protein
MSNIVPVADIERMATAVAKSGLFGIKTPEQGVALMLIAQAEGMHPAIAARDYHVIQGRPALKADAMLARFQSSGGKVVWKVYEDAEVTGEFSHPQGGTVTITWTFAQATKIGLTGKDNWRNYPRAMLRARVISEGIRTTYPGCVVGVYTPEEVEDFKDDPSSKASKVSKPPSVKDMGMVEVVESGKVTVTIEDPLPPDNSVPLFIPGQEEPYSHFADEADWIEGYADMIGRISNSAKFTEEQKKVKLEDLKIVNGDQLKKMNSSSLVRLRSAIAKVGGFIDPKSHSVLPPQEEPSETSS